MVKVQKARKPGVENITKQRQVSNETASSFRKAIVLLCYSFDWVIRYQKPIASVLITRNPTLMPMLLTMAP